MLKRNSFIRKCGSKTRK